MTFELSECLYVQIYTDAFIPSFYVPKKLQNVIVKNFKRFTCLLKLPVRMRDSSNFVLRCLMYILHFKVNFQTVHSPNQNII